MAKWRVYNSQARTASDGSFSFESVPEGAVEVCASGPGVNDLNPCLWRPGANTHFLTANQRVTGLTVQLVRGQSYRVDVADPNGLWPARTSRRAATIASEVLVGVRSPLLGFMPFRSKLVGASNQFEAVLPVGVPLIVEARSSGFELRDLDNGNTKAPSARSVRFLVRVGEPSGSARRIQIERKTK